MTVFEQMVFFSDGLRKLVYIDVSLMFVRCMHKRVGFNKFPRFTASKWAIFGTKIQSFYFKCGKPKGIRASPRLDLQRSRKDKC